MSPRHGGAGWPRVRTAFALGAWLVAQVCLGACTRDEPEPAANADEPAEVYALGGLEIIDPWAKSAIGVHDAKLFFEFRNLGDADRLVAARSAAAAGPSYFRLATRESVDGAVQTLDSVPIPSTTTPYEFSEIGYYIELTGMEIPLVMGKQFAVELRFERAGSIAIPFTTRFHSPKLGRRIREAAQRGDLEALRTLRDQTGP